MKLRPGKIFSGVVGNLTQFLLNLKQPVVLGSPFSPNRHSGLDLAAVEGHDQVGNNGIFCFTGTFGYLYAVSVAIGVFRRVKGFGKRTDLIYFEQHGIGRTHAHTFFQPLNIGDKKIITDDLDLKFAGEDGGFECVIDDEALY